MVELYVSSVNGSNNNNGSFTKPYKTIQYAVNLANAGDTIFVLNGTYKERVQINKSGHSQNPIKLVNYPGHKPIISGIGIKWIGNGVWGGLINLNKQSHWIFEGLRLEDSYAMGFGEDYSEPVSVGSRNILIKNCSVTNAGSSGVFIYYGENITIDNLIATRTNKNLGQEGISLVNIDRFEIKNCQIIDCYKEGIDVKNGCKNGSIHHCFVSNAVRVGFYVDAFASRSYNINLYNNIAKMPNGVGFSTGVEAGGTLEDVIFQNNIVYDSQRGYNVSSNNDETNLSYTMRNIILRNNVAYNSGFTGVFIVADVKNLLIENNVLFPSKNYSINCIHVYDLNYTNVNEIIVRNNILSGITSNNNMLRGENYILVKDYTSIVLDPNTGSPFRN